MQTELTCNICRNRVASAAGTELSVVRSNVRRFRDEKFNVWRCAGCASIHARDEVDLDHYYAGYPIFSAELDWKLRIVYANLLRRLTRSGLRREHRILDYGCGSGSFVEYLRQKGYPAFGYDAYAQAFADTAVLGKRYDCIVSQDVVEHVPDPLDLLRRFDELVEPGGLVAIGTPDAKAIDLGDTDDFIHTLHQPYHRHIFSSAALRAAAESLDWSVEEYYSTMYINTLIPTMNPRFVLHYVRCHDDSFDLITEPPRIDSFRLWSLVSLFWALFGYFFDRHTDVMFVFRTRAR